MCGRAAISVSAFLLVGLQGDRRARDPSTNQKARFCFDFDLTNGWPFDFRMKTNNRKFTAVTFFFLLRTAMLRPIGKDI